MGIDLKSIKPIEIKELKNVSGIVFGKTKVGKTTLASQFPNSIILDLEGTASLVDGAMVQKIDTYEELLEAVVQAMSLFDTIVFDGLKYLIMLFESYTCKKLGRSSMREHKYADTYNDSRTNITNFVKRLLGKGKNIIFLAHESDEIEIDELTDEEISIKAPFIPDKDIKKILPALVDFCGHLYIKTKEDGEKERLLDITSNRYKVTGNRIKINEIMINPTYLDFERLFKKGMGAKSVIEVKKPEEVKEIKVLTKTK